MVGNSLRSDILPVLEPGAWAVHIPPSSCGRKKVNEDPVTANPRFRRLRTLAELPAALASFATG